PSWLTYAGDYLSDEGLGNEWTDCVKAWLAFEASFGYTEASASRLPESKSRPAIISRWLQSRKYGQTPLTFDDAATFAQEWTTWWGALQPEWRKPPHNCNLPKLMSTMSPDDDIHVLRKGGPSGLVTVVIGLKWWG
ncbi:hypothetical protein M378DRAFT_63096, partial [Amanita muscaria Koide BX008]